MIIIKGDSDFYILLVLSIIIILPVFKLGKDSDTIESNVESSCNRIYANMYKFGQFCSIYSVILLWRLFGTYSIQTKELQLLFRIIIHLMTLVCIIWSDVIIIQLFLNDFNCYDIIKNYDGLRVYMQITNFIILNLIFIFSIICIIIYKIKNRNKKINDLSDSDMIELGIS